MVFLPKPSNKIWITLIFYINSLFNKLWNTSKVNISHNRSVIFNSFYDDN